MCFQFLDAHVESIDLGCLAVTPCAEGRETVLLEEMDICQNRTETVLGPEPARRGQPREEEFDALHESFELEHMEVRETFLGGFGAEVNQPEKEGVHVGPPQQQVLAARHETVKDGREVQARVFSHQVLKHAPRRAQHTIRGRGAFR